MPQPNAHIGGNQVIGFNSSSTAAAGEGAAGLWPSDSTCIIRWTLCLTLHTVKSN